MERGAVLAFSASSLGAAERPGGLRPEGIEEPEGVAASPDGRWAAITSEAGNALFVLKTGTDRIEATVPIHLRPRAAQFSPDGSRLYVTAELGAALTIVDTRSWKPIQRVPTPGGVRAVGVLVPADGRRVWVTTRHGNTIAVLDSEKLEFTGPIPVGKRAWGDRARA